MRTYKILHARAQAFDADSEVREITAERADPSLEGLVDSYSRQKADRLRDVSIDHVTPAKEGLRYERLDQLMMEYIMGVRG